MTIAIDFDGTIVEHRYPKIGKPIEGAIDTILQLQKAGHKLILWTYRYGEALNEAVAFCEKQGIQFYAVNKSAPEEEWRLGRTRLIEADVFIDDRNIGGLMPWDQIAAILLK